jgi:hypothetical protein
MRIVKAGRSKYDGPAPGDFERARRCFLKAGLGAEWERTVTEVRSHYHRETGFMPGFEKIPGGAEATQKPSFLERAKARWGENSPGGA